MHRLEITGNTPEELYFNCIKTLSIMLKGAGTQPMPANEPVVETAVIVEETAVEQPAPVAEETAPIAEVIPPKKRGPKPRVKTDDLNDPVPDLGGAPADTKKELTLDGDIKPQLQAISAACTKRGMSMPDTVAYIQKLYAPFGIAKAPQLRPEQYEEFLEASESYLSGEAPC
jgi:hypothetical protein